jgi:UDP-N-acetylglucosamine diphosphorylase/glucosamine-1-phosphate N-acetyltransferase
MELVLFSEQAELLYPLTLSKPSSMLRTGILTSSEKWEKIAGLKVKIIPEERLKRKFLSSLSESDSVLLVNDRLVPQVEIVNLVLKLPVGKGFKKGNTWLAYHCSSFSELEQFSSSPELEKLEEIASTVYVLTQPADLFIHADEFIKHDFHLLTNGRASQPLSDDNRLIGPQNQLFIEEGAHVYASVINTSAGPVYIGKGAEIMEGCLIRGPLSLGRGSSLKMGSKIYGPSVIGPYSKVGGEFSNSVILGYSNKAHDGFVGNSVIGEWCNLGADTNTSNLKNNYSKVKIWNYATTQYTDSGLTFCGLIMGDHSKCGINTMFNTGTVVGVCANIFGPGFPPKFVPSFTWGGSNGFVTYELEQAIVTAKRVYARRGRELDQTDTDILTDIYHYASKFRG